MKQTLCFVSAITFFLLTFLGAQGQPTPINVSGEVRGVDGLPKRFARVQLDGKGSYVAITNTRGEFSINNVIPGRYTVTITQGDNVQKFSMDLKDGPTPRKIIVKW